MLTCEQDCPPNPVCPHAPTALLRVCLIKEEHKELEKALIDKDLLGITDALADLMYVVLGTACACGIDLEPIFAEVHRSNMSKAIYIEGSAIPLVIKNHQGKVLKPATYTPPNLQPLLLAQILKK